MSFSITETFNTSAQFQFSTTAIQVLGGSTGFATLQSPYFSTSGFLNGPILTSQILLQASSVTSFSDVKATTGADEIRYIVQANGNPYYYSTTTGAWVSSNLSFANSTPSSAMNPNVSSFFSTLGLVGNANIAINPLFYSSSGVTAPQLTSFTVGYTCVVDPAANPNQCTVYAYLSNLLGGTVAPSTNTPATLWISSDRGYFYGNKYIEPFATSSQFNSSGYASVTVNETTTPGKEVQVYITYYESQSLKTVKFLNCLIPNQATISLSQLTSIKPQDFG